MARSLMFRSLLLRTPWAHWASTSTNRRAEGGRKFEGGFHSKEDSQEGVLLIGNNQTRSSAIHRMRFARPFSRTILLNSVSRLGS